MKPTELVCYGRVRTANSQQEWYDTKSGHARIRARELRDHGFAVYNVHSSEQITSVGRVRMSLVTIHGLNDMRGWEVDPFGPAYGFTPVRIERL